MPTLIDPQITVLSYELMPQCASPDNGRVPLPSTPRGFEPTALDQNDPLGLDGTISTVTTSDGKEHVCTFQRVWFYDKEGTENPQFFGGIFLLCRSSDPVPNNIKPIAWPPLPTADARLAFRLAGPSGDQYYRLSLLNAIDTVVFSQNVSQIDKVRFKLYKISSTPIPSPSGSSSSSLVNSNSSSSSAHPSTSSSSSYSSASDPNQIDPLILATVYAETKQIQQQIQTAQLQAQSFVNQIGDVKSMADITTMLDGLPQIMGSLLTAIGTASGKVNALADTLAKIILKVN